MIELSKVARMVLKDRKLKQKLAAYAGVTENTIYAWLRPGSKDLLRMDLLLMISDETGIPVSDLICKPETVSI